MRGLNLMGKCFGSSGGEGVRRRVVKGCRGAGGECYGVGVMAEECVLGIGRVCTGCLGLLMEWESEGVRRV